jgi:hypothetical protein
MGSSSLQILPLLQVYTEKTMRLNKIAVLGISILLFTFVLSACSTSSSGNDQFPTGRFTSATEKFISYQFNQDKTWEYYDAGTVQASGTYQVKGNQWIENGTEECNFPGTYEWTFDGMNLSFKLVGDDACSPRKAATDGQTFVLLSEP